MKFLTNDKPTIVGAAGMTREDLLKGNASIAEGFGKNVKTYCPDVRHVVVIFNPADITGS